MDTNNKDDELYPDRCSCEWLMYYTNIIITNRPEFAQVCSEITAWVIAYMSLHSNATFSSLTLLESVSNERLVCWFRIYKAIDVHALNLCGVKFAIVCNVIEEAAGLDEYEDGSDNLCKRVKMKAFEA